MVLINLHSISYLILMIIFTKFVYLRFFQVVYPGHVKLSEQEKTNICYLAFPDSNSGCMGDTQFHMRIRQAPGRHPLRPEHRAYNQKCPAYLQIQPGYFYGFVYFRQVKDKTIPRGYFQKVNNKLLLLLLS